MPGVDQRVQMHVRQLDLSNQKDTAAFIDLPFHLYRAYPLWMPRMRSEMQMVLNPSEHPFYRFGEAAYFLAERDGHPVGRIAALNNHRYNEHNQSRTGFFYYFECAEDWEAAEGLFAEAFAWLERQGLEEVIGPKGLLQGDSAGLLIEGFDHRPAMGVAYNPPYYGKMLEAMGFEKVTDFHSGYMPGDYRLPARIRRIATRVKERQGYRVKRFANAEELRSWVPRVRQVYNRSFDESFQGPLGFAPMTDEEIELIADRLLALARPELIKLVLQGEELVGFLFTYPNIGPGMRRARGRLWPFGWLHLLWERWRTRWLDINGIGVLPAHQGRGANAVLYAELEETVRPARFAHADIVQIREENIKSMGDAKALGVNWYKRHRIYRRALTPRHLEISGR